MTTFPVSNSIVSASHLGSFLQSSYGLSTEARCEIFRTGINHTYMVSDQDKKYVFRLYTFNWRTACEIGEEIRLLNHLKEEGVPVSYPIMDIHQQYIQKLLAPEGVRYGVLFSYAPGKKVRDLTPELCHRSGELMAEMHQITEKMELDRVVYNLAAFTNESYARVEKHFAATNEDLGFIKKAGELLLPLFSTANTNQIRHGVIHLDIWYDNMQVHNDSDITFFDFDFCGNGWLLHDIAYFLMQLFHVEVHKEEYELKKEAFISGYESVTPISSEEKRLLPYSGLCSWVFYLGVQSQRFDDWSNVFLSENYLTRYTGMLKNWLTYNEVEVIHG